MSQIHDVFARKRSAPSLRPTTPSNQKPREIKSLQYILLAAKGSFMAESALGITGKSKVDYQTLLSAEQQIPKDSLFRDDRFPSTLQSTKTKLRIESSGISRS